MKKPLFSKNIKILRQNFTLTQEEAAKKLGISRSTLNSYEYGSIKNPSIKMLKKFSKIYNTSIDDMLKKSIPVKEEKRIPTLSGYVVRKSNAVHLYY